MSLKLKIIKSNFDSLAANHILKENNSFGNFCVALPTGNTPIGMYGELAKKNIGWQKIKIFMLDVNYPQDPDEPTSFYSFAKKYLPTDKFEILNSQTKDPNKECLEYEAKIKKAGDLDLAVLGIGENGHIAYNEPGTNFDSLTHLANLSKETIKINHLKTSQGLTMGIKTIMAAKKILVLAKGINKASVVMRAITGSKNINLPASVLQSHPNVTWLLDEAAANLLK